MYCRRLKEGNSQKSHLWWRSYIWNSVQIWKIKKQTVKEGRWVRAHTKTPTWEILYFWGRNQIWKRSANPRFSRRIPSCHEERLECTDWSFFTLPPIFMHWRLWPWCFFLPKCSFSTKLTASQCWDLGFITFLHCLSFLHYLKTFQLYL